MDGKRQSQLLDLFMRIKIQHVLKMPGEKKQQTDSQHVAIEGGDHWSANQTPLYSMAIPWKKTHTVPTIWYRK